jgi:hypothetical protein
MSPSVVSKWRGGGRLPVRYNLCPALIAIDRRRQMLLDDGGQEKSQP